MLTNAHRQAAACRNVQSSFLQPCILLHTSCRSVTADAHVTLACCRHRWHMPHVNPSYATKTARTATMHHQCTLGVIPLLDTHQHCPTAVAALTSGGYKYTGKTWCSTTRHSGTPHTRTQLKATTAPYSTTTRYSTAVVYTDCVQLNVYKHRSVLHPSAISRILLNAAGERQKQLNTTAQQPGCNTTANASSYSN